MDWHPLPESIWKECADLSDQKQWNKTFPRTGTIAGWVETDFLGIMGIVQVYAKRYMITRFDTFNAVPALHAQDGSVQGVRAAGMI